MKTIIATTLLVCYLTVVNAHTYHMGACPVVEPQQGFEMNKVLNIIIEGNKRKEKKIL